MTDDLLVLGALWCFAAFCFAFGWIMGSAAALGKHADDLAERCAAAAKRVPRTHPRFQKLGRW